MAEEGTIGLPRASERDDDDAVEPSKEELQRRMEEARETITQTVTEIKETVTNQYYSMKETVSDALDWRYHFRNNPIAFSVGALSVGFLVGYGLAGTFKGEGDEREGYPSSDETDVYARMDAVPSGYEAEDSRHSAFHGHSYAAQPITDKADESAGQQQGSAYEAEDESDYGRASSGGTVSYLPPREASSSSPEKTGLFERFKGTTAYDRLQSEVSTLGDRFIDELSTTAQTVVLPALFNKIKEMFGVDLGGNKGGQSSQGTQQESQAGGGSESNTGARAASASASSASASLANASRGSSESSYATSENRPYGVQATGREGDKGGEGGSSVLDLDR
ncbi:MAG TPA: hypothetical protein VM095_14640 [Pyrinomonadaceae bacterium]|nr:hypothetical protein [Pyrinomonadaceae bacterium]